MEVDNTKSTTHDHEKTPASSLKEQRGEKRSRRVDSHEKVTPMQALEEQAVRDDVATKLSKANYTGPTRQPFTPNVEMIRQVSSPYEGRTLTIRRIQGPEPTAHALCTGRSTTISP